MRLCKNLEGEGDVGRYNPFIVTATTMKISEEAWDEFVSQQGAYLKFGKMGSDYT